MSFNLIATLSLQFIYSTELKHDSTSQEMCFTEMQSY